MQYNQYTVVHLYYEVTLNLVGRITVDNIPVVNSETGRTVARPLFWIPGDRSGLTGSSIAEVHQRLDIQVAGR